MCLFPHYDAILELCIEDEQPLCCATMIVRASFRSIRLLLDRQGVSYQPGAMSLFRIHLPMTQAAAP